MANTDKKLYMIQYFSSNKHGGFISKFYYDSYDLAYARAISMLERNDSVDMYRIIELNKYKEGS